MNFSLLHADRNVLLWSPDIPLPVVASIHKRRRLKGRCGFCGQTVINQTEALCWATKKDNCAALLLKAPLWENLPRPRLPPPQLPNPAVCFMRLQTSVTRNDGSSVGGIAYSFISTLKKASTSSQMHKRLGGHNGFAEVQAMHKMMYFSPRTHWPIL